MSNIELIDKPQYIFPVIKGIQSQREYFVTMIPLRLIPNLFLFNEKEIPPKLRSQRKLNKSRIPVITKYLLDNSEDYVFSSLTASIDRLVEFTPIPQDNPNSKIGYIMFPTDTKIVINDGQHRRAAITEALKKKPELGYETISVVFFIDTGLEKSQQMFSDLNRYAVKPSGSLNILYDHRDPFSNFVLEMIEEVPVFQNNIDFEKTSISNRSKKLFTLSSVYRATKTLFGSLIHYPLDKKDITVEFWNEVTSYMKPWRDFLKGKPPYLLRQATIGVHDLTLQAIALVGATSLKSHPDDWKDIITKLETIDWRRSNTYWEGRALIAGRLRKSHTNVVLTANYLKEKLGLSLSDRELEYENSLVG